MVIEVGVYFVGGKDEEEYDDGYEVGDVEFFIYGCSDEVVLC